MQRIWKRFVRVLLAFVVLWGASELWNAIDVDAQQRTRRRTTNRAKLWLSMRNNGTLGHSLDGGDIFGPEVGMSYPGRWTSTYRSGIVNRVNRQDNSRGNGMWVMARTDDGRKFVSLGGPRKPSADIFPIQHHPRNNVESIGPIWRSVWRSGGRPFNLFNYGQNAALYWPRMRNMKIKSHFVNGEAVEYQYAVSVYGGLGQRGFPPGPDKVEPMDYYNWGFGFYPLNKEAFREMLTSSYPNVRNGLNQMRSNGVPTNHPRLSPELLSENLLVTGWSQASGITVKRMVHAYSTPGTDNDVMIPVPSPDGSQSSIVTRGDYDDFLLTEIEFWNNGDTDGDGQADAGYPKQLDEVYIVVKNGFITSKTGAEWVPAGGSNSNAWDFVQPSTQDDYWRYTQAENYDHPEYALNYRGAPMHLTYVYDGDAVARLWNDLGEPYTRSRAQHQYVSTANIIDGTLLSPQYIGMMPIATGTADHPFNALDTGQGYKLPQGPQPHAVFRWRMYSSALGDDPHGGTHGQSQLFDYYSDADGALSDTDTDRMVQYHDNDELGAWVDAQVYGPYTLGPGDKAKVVIAYVAGMASNSAKYRADTEGYARPYEWNWQQQSLVNELELGLEAIYAHANEAQKLYDLGFDGVNQPPDVKVNGFTNLASNIELNWSGVADTAIDPDLGRPDVVGYRIYRSDFVRAGPWKLLATVPKAEGPEGNRQLPSGAPAGVSFLNEPWAEGQEQPAEAEVDGPFRWGTYTFIDPEPDPGFIHHYSIRAYDEQGLETGHSDERNQYLFPADGIVPRVTSALLNDENERMALPIRVVPNPWVQGRDEHSYGAPRIRWVNVPSRCTLYIYTLSGDLAWRQTFDTLDPQRSNPVARGEIEWDTHTVGLNANTRGRLNAGTYIWAIESHHPESMGQIQKGLFVIIN